jgi:hypothetical protein
MFSADDCGVNSMRDRQKMDQTPTLMFCNRAQFGQIVRDYPAVVTRPGNASRV